MKYLDWSVVQKIYLNKFEKSYKYSLFSGHAGLHTGYTGHGYGYGAYPYGAGAGYGAYPYGAWAWNYSLPWLPHPAAQAAVVKAAPVAAEAAPAVAEEVTAQTDTILGLLGPPGPLGPPKKMRRYFACVKSLWS